MKLKDGCDVHPHCLSCPLPRCRYDTKPPHWIERDMQVHRMYHVGIPVQVIARQTGLSVPQVKGKIQDGAGTLFQDRSKSPGYILPVEQLEDRLRAGFKRWRSLTIASQ